MNVLEVNDNIVVIDYAHTPDALENICRALKQSYSKTLLTIFGCGGDRDRSKRPQMAKAASLYSDKLIITTDNPRTERPEAIIEDIIPGIPNGKDFHQEVDRKIAITKALSECKDTVILIAGKGHEDYMDIMGSKVPYSDLNVVKEFMNG